MCVDLCEPFLKVPNEIILLPESVQQYADEHRKEKSFENGEPKRLKASRKTCGNNVRIVPMGCFRVTIVRESCSILTDPIFLKQHFARPIILPFLFREYAPQ